MDKGYSPSQITRTCLKAESTNYCRLLRCWVWRTKGSRPHLAGRPVAWRPVPPVAGGCPSLATTVCPWLTHRHRHLLGRTDADVGISDEAKTLRTVAPPGASEVLPSNHNGKKPAASRRFSKPRNSSSKKDNHILMDRTNTTILSFA